MTSPWSRRSHLERASNRLTLLDQRLRRAGRRPLDLTISNPTLAGIPYAEDAIVAALADPAILRYEPLPFGRLEARAAVAQTLARDGLTPTADHVLLTASTSEAYGFLFKLLCDPGDSVLVPVPGYPLLEHLSAFESVQTTPYALLQDDDWAVDRQALQQAMDERTRAIVVVQPNNPTGSVLRADDLAWLGSLGVPLIGDEVFADYLLEGGPDDEADFHSVLTAPTGLVFALGGLSKSAALPQLKAGWITVGGEPELVAGALARLELIADTWLSTGLPVQVALPELLASGHVARDAISARTGRNLTALRQALGTESPITVPRIAGGWMTPIRLQAIRDDEAWAMHLLEHADVRVQPGHFYDFQHGAWLVISLLTQESTFDAGVGRIIAAVAAG